MDLYVLVSLFALVVLLVFVLVAIRAVPPARRRIDLPGLAAVLLAIATVLAAVAARGHG